MVHSSRSGVPSTGSERVTITERVTVGALLRRQFRVALDVAGIAYREHKGWLDSVFVITTTAATWQRIEQWAEEVSNA